MSTLVTSNIKHSGSASNNVELDSSGNLKFNSGYGSAAVAYGCRAWVNFNGTTSPGTIRASGNVSSVTKNGTGDYTINLTNAMPNTNYCVLTSCIFRSGVTFPSTATLAGPFATNSFSIYAADGNNALFDPTIITVAIFR